MRKKILAFFITALSLFYNMGTANSHSNSKITTEDLAGNWVTVQLAITPSAGLVFGNQTIPAGVSISSVTLWNFDKDGACKRKGFANFDGNAVDLNVSLSECSISLNEDGTGTINIESLSAGSSEVKIIVINKNEIAATSFDSAVTAFTFKRQKLKKRNWKY